MRPLGRRPAGTSGWSCFRLASPQDVPPTHPHSLTTSSSSSYSLFKRIHQRMCCPPTHYHYNDRIFEMPMECLFKKDNFVLWWIFPYLDCGKSRFCRKFWSNFDSNFPNDDIVHRAQSDVPDVSRNFFTEYPSYPGFFLLYISDYQNISWIFMTCIPRAPRANCGIFIQEQIQIRFKITKNFFEKIRIWDLMVAGGNLLPLSFF